MNNDTFFLSGVIPIILILLVFYFVMVRPQNKKDKEQSKMRSGLQPGDEVVTIGGIVGKVVKTKPDSVILQVGAERTKIEIMRWGVQKIVSEATGAKAAANREADSAAEGKSKKLPKRLKKDDAVDEIKIREIDSNSGEIVEAVEEIKE